MLDNGYVYLAGSRLSLFRSSEDWALVIEVFGYSPRAGLPDTSIQTFGSRLHNRDTEKNYVSRRAYEMYLSKNPHNEFRTVFPLDEGPWMDSENPEAVASSGIVVVRGEALPLPDSSRYEQFGVRLSGESPMVFELCRYLAAIRREQVLATAEERRVSILPEMNQILQLEEWSHPNLVDGERPSETECFQQLARTLETGNVGLYQPGKAPNTHWSNWPEGGTL